MVKLSTCSCRGDSGTELRSGAMVAFVCRESTSIVRQGRAVDKVELMLDRQCSHRVESCMKGKRKALVNDKMRRGQDDKRGRVNGRSTKGKGQQVGSSSRAKTRRQ